MVEYERVDLNEVMEEVKTDFELPIAETKAVIRNNGLPVVKGNRLQLSQLFANLLSNSLKFAVTNPEIVIGSASFELEQPEEAEPMTISGFVTANFNELLSRF